MDTPSLSRSSRRQSIGGLEQKASASSLDIVGASEQCIRMGLPEASMVICSVIGTL